MELLTLRTFLTVVNEGGIHAASHVLNTVQSNVSTRIQRLEQELDTTLFYRQGRQLKLTPSGRVLLDYTERMLQLERQADTAVRMAEHGIGKLRLGSSDTFAATILPEVLAHLKNTYPDLEAFIETETSGPMVEAVINHRLDCAFVSGPVEHPDIISHEVGHEELVLVTATGNYNDNVLILFREGCEFRNRAQTWQASQGRPAMDVMEIGTPEGILGCVAAGLGITLTVRRLVEQSHLRERLQCHKLDPELAYVPTVLIQHRQAKPLHMLFELFDEQTIQTLKKSA